jgi:hypothetical protein
MYLPADDRRTYVAWSNRKKEEFGTTYWRTLFGWYANGGNQHVADYLAAVDLSNFDAKAPPPKTAAFWAIVDSNRAPEEGELADAIDKLENPDAVTLDDVKDKACPELYEWLRERKNLRAIPHRFESVGYIPVRNPDSKQGFWNINKTRQVVYAKNNLPLREQLQAVAELQRKREEDERKREEDDRKWKEENHKKMAQPPRRRRFARDSKSTRSTRSTRSTHSQSPLAKPSNPSKKRRKDKKARAREE